MLPEEQLLWAILNQAIKDYLYEAFDEYLSAEFYIFHSNDTDFPSFSFICDYFGIDNEKLKASIRERRARFEQLGYYKDKKATKTLIKNYLGLKERDKSATYNRIETNGCSRQIPHGGEDLEEYLSLKQ
ncbi:MAG: hypothetical protein D6736_08325 [Nitrospinota bacterium]|nr:MAG: hypothetical protein D6736_08325 [Nitrospinota bacterium]